jgi:hypothetical protein
VMLNVQIATLMNFKQLCKIRTKWIQQNVITRNMGQDGDGHAHFDQIWRPNVTINYMGVDQNIKFWYTLFKYFMFAELDYSSDTNKQYF